MKTCNQCGILKDDSNFYKGRNQCKPCAIETSRNWNIDNKKKVKVYKENFLSNNDIVAINKEYRSRPDRKLAQKVLNNIRINRERNAEGKFSAYDIQSIYQKQKGLCNMCSTDISENKYHINHIFALVRGGSNWPSNLQLLCPKCNMHKGSKILFPVSIFDLTWTSVSTGGQIAV